MLFTRFLLHRCQFEFESSCCRLFSSCCCFYCNIVIVVFLPGICAICNILICICELANTLRPAPPRPAPTLTLAVHSKNTCDCDLHYFHAVISTPCFFPVFFQCFQFFFFNLCFSCFCAFVVVFFSSFLYALHAARKCYFAGIYYI